MGLGFNKVTYKTSLKNFSYDFKEETITTILSGEDLSFFTYLICRLENDYTGEITNTFKGRNIGTVFYNPEEIFIFDTVREELLFGLDKYNYKISTKNKRIEDSLKMVNLPISYLDKNPFELSSGERKLLALAIVLSLNPKLIVIDFLNKNLDKRNEEYILKVLKKIKNKYHKTIIILSNDIESAVKASDNYLILKRGKLLSEGNIKNIINDLDKLKSAKLEIPKIIEFINKANKDKNINLELTFDIKELMKDVYRNVK